MSKLGKTQKYMQKYLNTTNIEVIDQPLAALLTSNRPHEERCFLHILK